MSTAWERMGRGRGLVRVAGACAALALLMAAAPGPGGGAGPSDGSGPVGTGPGAPTREMSREEARRRLDAFLAEMDEIQSRTREAIAKLDAGAPLPEVMGAFPRVQRFLAAGERGGERFGEGLMGERGLREGPRDGEAEGPGFRRGRAPVEMTDEQVKAMRGFIDANVPMLADRLARAEQISPGASERLLRRMAPRLMQLRELQAEEPAFAEASLREFVAGLDVLEATRGYRMVRGGEDAAAAEGARARLEGALQAHFDARLAVQELEIARSEARLAAGREELSRLRERRAALIAEKVGEIERGEHLWGPGVGAGGGPGGP